MTDGPEDDSFDTRAEAAMARHHRTSGILRRYNNSLSDDATGRRALLHDLLGHCGDGVWIEPPFFCDDGGLIRMGDGVFMNFNCVILDGAEVVIGDGTLLGPAVQIHAVGHPIRAEDRMFDRDGIPGYRTTAAPVTIGRNCWIGGGAILSPGVQIGDGTTIGAGSVVTRSIPDNVFAAGSPLSRHPGALAGPADLSCPR